MTASTALAPRLTPASLPTYRTVAAVLERQNGAGIRLAGWTVARTLLIAPPMIAVGVPAKKAFMGAGLASILISTFTILRIFNAEWETRQQKKAPRGREKVIDVDTDE